MLPIDAARAWLAEEPTPAVPAADELDDLSAAEFARLVKRNTRTVCEWFADGLVQGAYKLRARTWRVPREKARAFLDAQEKPKPPPVPVTLKLADAPRAAGWRDPTLNCYGQPYKRLPRERRTG